MPSTHFFSYLAGGSPPTPPLAPTTDETSVTYRNATYEFDAAYPVGYSATGIPFSINATLDNTLPASIEYDGTFSGGAPYVNRWIHGLMESPGNEGGTGADPTLTPQGWDSPVGSAVTEFAYSDALNVAPEKTAVPLSGEAAWVKAVSIELNIDPAGRDRVADMSFLYNLDAVPYENSFMRWAGSSDLTPWFTVDDLDLTVLPSLAQPSGSTLPTAATILAETGPFQLFMNQMLYARGTVGGNQQQRYGGDIARDVTEAMMFTMTAGVDPDERLQVIYKLVEAGQMIADACEQGRRWSSSSFSFGGAHQWLKVLVVYAARLLRNAANTTALAIVEKWADAGQQKVFADDMMLFPIDRARIENVNVETITSRLWPVPYPDWSETIIDWNSKPSSGSVGLAYRMSYRDTNSYPMMASALITRAIGADTLWGNDEFYDYCDRWYNLWTIRGQPDNTSAEAYFGLYNAAMCSDYYETYSPAYSGTGSATLVLREARNTSAYLTYDENLDIAFQPSASDIVVEVDGTPVSLTSVTKTGCSGTASTGSTNVAEPVISVPNTTGIRIGDRVENALLPADTFVTRIPSATTVGINEYVPSGFTGQSVTFHHAFCYGRQIVGILPTTLTSGSQVVEMSYTAPGSGFVRNLNGTSVGSAALAVADNRTGELPDPVTTREVANPQRSVSTGGQWSTAPVPASETVNRLWFTVDWVIFNKTVNMVVVSGGNGGTTQIELYASTANDLRLLMGAGHSFRMPGDLAALPTNTLIRSHFIIDFTQTTAATTYRGVHRWNGGERVAATTGSTGTFTGTYTINLATVFQSPGMSICANGNGVDVLDGAIGMLNMGWGNSLPVNTNFADAAFAWNADPGGNGENIWGQVNQRYYAGPLSAYNGGIANAGNGGAVYAMTPRNLVSGGDGELATNYIIWP